MPEDIIKVENGRLIMDVLLTAPVKSKSGKTNIVYSTGGFIDVDGKQLSVNLTQKN